MLVGCGAGSLGWHGAEATHQSAERTLAEYKREHFRALGDTIESYRSRDDVVSTISAGDVLWLGDRHDDARLHQAQLQLLADLHARGRRLILALEAIGRDDEPAVADYLAGSMNLRDLRATILPQPGGSWLDSTELDSAFYRALLALARDARFAVRALETIPRPPLARRDAEMAKRVRELHRQRGDALLVVIVGHVHIAGDDHLLDAARLGGVVLLPEASAPLRAAMLANPDRHSTHFAETTSGALLWPGTAR